VYVDANQGDPNKPGNTTLATGERLTCTMNASGSDNLWRVRAFANMKTVLESGGDFGATVNTEDCPRLKTSIKVPENCYKVYVYFWTDASAWRIRAALKNTEKELPLCIGNDMSGNATTPDANDFQDPVPLLTEDNRTLRQLCLGTTALTNMIDVYIDDDPNHLTQDNRTWYDGIGYEISESESKESKGDDPNKAPVDPNR
jgi:hypothetical protein